MALPTYPMTAPYNPGGREGRRGEGRDAHFSTVQWNLSIEDTFGTQLAVLYTVEPLYGGHHWDPAGCPVYSGTSL